MKKRDWSWTTTRLLAAYSLVMLRCGEGVALRDLEADAVHAAATSSATSKLESKAEAYLDVLTKRHVPFGQVWGAILKTSGRSAGTKGCDDGSETYTVTDTVSSYAGQGDGAIWTGVYTAALAYRCAVLKTSAACDLLKTQVGVLHTLLKVTGKPGLITRGYEPPSTTCGKKTNGTRDYCYLESANGVHSGSGAYAGYKFMGDISRDQYAGWMFGLATAYDLYEDSATRATIRGDVVEFVDTLMDNNWEITNADGTTLSFDPGTISFDRAIMSLSYLRTAYHMSGESRFKDAFDEKVSGWYNWLDRAQLWLCAADLTLTTVCDRDDYYRFNIVAMPLSTLIRIDTDSTRRTAYRAILDRLWSGNGFNFSGVGADKNALFDLFYLNGSGKSGLASVSDDTSKQLTLFPSAPLRRDAVSNPDIAEKTFCDNVASSALNIDKRPREDYAWQRSPTTINENCAQPWVERPGVDYLIAYWMARYDGYAK
ncbi:MAG: hypothetical protein HYY84_16545 [Deltaproteobacteria bacterium]|nr:hypothetical protein [Deltaproteobacteria bacterium]